MDVRRAQPLRRPGRASTRAVVAASAVPTGPPPGESTPIAPPPASKPKSAITATASPYQGAVMGIAQPIFVRFSSPVAFKARAEKNMRVYVSGVLSSGAWHWKDSQTAVFRPQTFWKSRSTIAIKMTMKGVLLAESSSRQAVAPPNFTARPPR